MTESTPRDRPHRGNRIEDARLVTGHGRFSADVLPPGALHACFARSDRAHAEIIALDTAQALRQPGVLAILTGADAVAAGYVNFFQMLSAPGLSGKGIAKPPRPVLAHARVRHVGEAVALVVAESANAAQDAASLVQITYRDLAAVSHAVNALTADAAQIHPEAPGNLAFEQHAGDAVATADAFGAAHRVVRLATESTRVAPTPMEPRACTVDYDAGSGCYTLCLPCQGINMMRLQMAHLTGIEPGKIIVHTFDVGGSFGQRSQSYPEYAALMLASRRLGRPVAWVSSRSEGFVCDTHGRGIHASGELALDRDGRFLGLRIDYTVDLGAYPTPGGPASHIRNPVACITNVYRIPAAHIRLRLVFTNTVPVASYRGAGRPDCVYAIERLVDQAAAELHIDPAELRRRNFVARESFPYCTPSGSVFEDADFAAVQARALTLADYAGFPARRSAASSHGRLRGIGVASAIEVAWAGVFPKDEIQLEVEPDGTITLVSVTQSSGQSHETTFAMIVAGVLDVDVARVRLRQSVNDVALIGNHTGGSRSLAVVGSLCALGARQLIERARPLAADALGVEPSQVAYAAGRFTSAANGDRIELATLANRSPHALRIVASASIGSTFPNTCHVAEVEIDPATGASAVQRYTVVDDCGNVVNRTVVEGQVHGAVLQGAGQVFGEHIVYEQGSAQLLTGSLMDYFMPRAGWLPAIALDECPTPTTANALGAKGVGEGGCVGALPALANAMMNALRPAGVTHLEMPMTPARVWHALRAVRRRGDPETPLGA